MKDIHLKVEDMPLARLSPTVPKPMIEFPVISSPTNAMATTSSSVSVGLDWGTPAAIAREKEIRKAKASEGHSGQKNKHVNSIDAYHFADNEHVLTAIERGNRRDKRRQQNDQLQKQQGNSDSPLLPRNEEVRHRTIFACLYFIV